MRNTQSLRTLLLTALGITTLLTHQGRAGLAVTDQQSTQTGVGYANGTIGTGFGQSFTPTLSTINAATFPLLVENGAIGVQLNLYSGAGFTGTLLDSSAPMTITNTINQVVEFDLATTQTLTPGSVYTLQLLLISGAGNILVGNYSIGDAYPRGAFYRQDDSTVYDNRDLVFAEGTAAPEPSTCAMIIGGMGLIVVGVLRRRTADFRCDE